MEEEALSWTADWLRERASYHPEEAREKGSRLLSVRSRWINTRRILTEEVRQIFGGDPRWRDLFASWTEEYQNYKRINQKVDYDDMMLALQRLFREEPGILAKYQKKYRWILVDEFQDVNRLQYELVLELSRLHRNLFAVGDDDQAIYGFRGSSPVYMNRFLQDLPDAKKIELTENFRCRPRIIEGSKNLISCNQNRFAKDLKPGTSNDRGRGEVKLIRCFHAEEQAAWIARRIRKSEPGSTIAVLVRTHKELSPLVRAMHVKGIAFEAEEDPQVLPLWSKIQEDLMAYLRFIIDSGRREDLHRILNRPDRQIPSSLADQEEADGRKHPELEELYIQRERLKDLPPDRMLKGIWTKLEYKKYAQKLQEEQRIPWREVKEHFERLVLQAQSCRSAAELLERWEAGESGAAESNIRVRLMTMHAAKGLEFDQVFLPNLNEGIVPNEQAVQEGTLEEERRIFYVAMTRARSRLFLLYTKERPPSRFLTDINPDNCL